MGKFVDYLTRISLVSILSCLITLFILSSINSIVFASETQLPGSMDMQELKKMMGDYMGNMKKSLEIQKKHTIPDEKYKIAENIKIKTGHLNGVLHTRLWDIIVKYDIQLKNMVYKNIVNQKEIDAALVKYQAAVKDVYKDTKIGAMTQSLENDYKRNSKAGGSPEFKCVVSGNALLTLRISQASTRMGVLGKMQTIVIECPFKASIGDGTGLADSQKIIKQLTTGYAEISNKNLMKDPDLYINFEFDFDRQEKYTFQQRLMGPVYQSGGQSGGGFPEGNYEKYPLAGHDEGFLDIKRFFNVLTAYGKFVDKSTKISMSVMEKISHVKMMDHTPFKRLGDDKGIGEIVANPKWPRPKGKKLDKGIYDFKARERSVRKIENDRLGYLAGDQYWMNQKHENGLLSNNVLLVKDKAQYYKIFRYLENGHLTIVKSEQINKQEYNKLKVNYKAKRTTWCNFAARVFADEYGLPKELTHTGLSANKIIDGIAKGRFGSGKAKFTEVRWNDAEKYASLGGLAFAVMEGNRHGHIAALVGGYSGAEISGNIEIYQAGRRFDGTILKHGFGGTNYENIQFYIWEMK